MKLKPCFQFGRWACWSCGVGSTDWRDRNLAPSAILIVTANSPFSVVFRPARVGVYLIEIPEGLDTLVKLLATILAFFPFFGYQTLGVKGPYLLSVETKVTSTIWSATILKRIGIVGGKAWISSLHTELLCGRLQSLTLDGYIGGQILVQIKSRFLWITLDLEYNLVPYTPRLARIARKFISIVVRVFLTTGNSIEKVFLGFLAFSLPSDILTPIGHHPKEWHQLTCWDSISTY